MNCPLQFSLPRFAFAALLGISTSAAWIPETDARPGRGGSFSSARSGFRGGSVDVQRENYGRYRSGNVDAEGPRGGSLDAEGTGYGRFGTGSVEATGPRGATYDASGARAGGYTRTERTVQNRDGDSRTVTTERFNGYRSNYVYVNGAYRPANIVVNTSYIAPLGAYAGLAVLTMPYYITYPFYATHPVETAVQVQLSRRGYYTGAVDGIIGAGTSAAISRYQAANGLAVTGTINQALLVSLGISPA